MNKRFLMILCVAAVIISLSAVFALHYKKSDEGSLSKGDLVLPGLAEDLANIQRVQITSAGAAAPYSLENTQTGWVVKERNHYPADFSKIRALLDQLSTAKFYEAKTSDADHYAMLGVADITDKNSPGVLVEVFVKNKPEPYRLLIGKLATTWDGSYARLPGQSQSWLLDRQIPVNSIVTAWLNNTILTIQPSRTYQVTYTTPEKATLIAQKNSPTEKHFVALNLPKGKEMRYDTVLNGVPQDFANIVMRDVQPSSEHALTPNDTYRVEIKTYDGLVIEIQTEKINDRFFMTMQAHYDEAIAKQFAATEPALATSVIAEADMLQKRAEGWVYEINEHVYVDLTKTMKDVLPETESKNSAEKIITDDKHSFH